MDQREINKIGSLDKAKLKCVGTSSYSKFSNN